MSACCLFQPSSQQPEARSCLPAVLCLPSPHPGAGQHTWGRSPLRGLTAHSRTAPKIRTFGIRKRARDLAATTAASAGRDGRRPRAVLGPKGGHGHCAGASGPVPTLSPGLCVPAGAIHLEFHSSGNHYVWRKVTSTVHNIIVGKLWIDQVGAQAGLVGLGPGWVRPWGCGGEQKRCCS